MPPRDYLIAKYRALTWLSSFIRNLENWREVWSAFRNGQPLPPFVLRGGMVLTCGPQDDLAVLLQEIFFYRCYTKGFYVPKPGDTVLDIGANIGVFAVFLHWLCPGVRVHSFEPMARTREQFEMNIKANRLADSVTLHPLAVGAEVGTLTLHHGQLTTETSVIPWSTGAQPETVPCINLATALQLAGPGPIHMLKIDTEGSEVEILGGIGRTVLDSVQRVAVEYHDISRPGCREFVTRALRDSGYSHIEDMPYFPDGKLGLIRASR